MHKAVDFISEKFDEFEQRHKEREEIVKNTGEDVTNSKNKADKLTAEENYENTVKLFEHLEVEIKGENREHIHTHTHTHTQIENKKRIGKN